MPGGHATESPVASFEREHFLRNASSRVMNRLQTMSVALIVLVLAAPTATSLAQSDATQPIREKSSQPPIAKGHWSYRDGKPESVTFDYGTVLTAPEIDRLSGTRSIVRISMGYAGIDSEYVTLHGETLRLGRLKNLRDVHLCKDGIHDDDLRFIALLPKIQALEFNADNGYEEASICTDRCADHLSAAKTLRTLIIHDGQFTDAFVAQITDALTDLRELSLNSPELTDESLRLIANRCKKLTSLSIASDHFTVEGVKQLSQLKRLRSHSVVSPELRRARRGEAEARKQHGRLLDKSAKVKPGFESVLAKGP